MTSQRRQARVAVLLAGLAALTMISAATPATAATAKCSHTAALFPNPLPFSRRNPTESVVLVSAFQHGLWVGEAYDGNTSTIISWHPGARHARRFGHFHYQRWNGYGPDPASSLNAVGVTPRGAVVAKAQTTSGAGHLQWPPIRGIAWTRSGRRVLLRGFPHALAVEPVVVTTRGHVIGAVAVGRPNRYHYLVAQWRTIFSKPRVIARLRRVALQPLANRRGDVVWATSTGWSHVRLVDGEQRVLAPRYAQAAVAAGSFVTDYSGKYRWHLPVHAAAGPVHGRTLPTASREQAQALSAAGDLIYGHYYGPDRDFVRYANGMRAELPRQFDQDGWSAAFDGRRRIGYTSRGDHLAHLFSCHLD